MARMLMKDCAATQVVIPAATSLEKTSGASFAILYPLSTKSKIIKIIIEARISPSSSEITAKIESVAASGK